MAVGAVMFAAVVYASSVSGAVPGFDSGADPVAGFTAGRVHYVLDPARPDHVAAVTFTIHPAAATVTISASLSGGGPAVYRCRTAASGVVTCPTTGPQLTAPGLTGITVVAAE